MQAVERSGCCCGCPIALDECENQRQLIQLFFAFTRAGASVLLTSRNYPYLEDAFASCDQIYIQASDDDLRAYISHKLDKLRHGILKTTFP